MSRRWPSLALATLAPVTLALLVALGVANLLMILYGQPPLAVWRVFLAGTWGTPYGVGQILFKATPLVLTGLAVAVPLRAGLLNVGAEGQAAIGAFAIGAAGVLVPRWLPDPLAAACCLAAGFLVGAGAGALPGLLKAWRGAHEVIVTILLNFVILAKLSDCGKPYYAPESVHMAPIARAAELPRASELFSSLHGSSLSAAALVALAAAFAVQLLLRHTPVGLRLRVVGHNAEAANAAGISVGAHQVLALALGGGLAGLVGASAVLGHKHYYEEGGTMGVGFMGIAVALLGRSHPLGIVLAALLLGTLAQGGLAINALVPRELVDVLQAVLTLAVAAAAAAVARARLVDEVVP